MIIVYLVFLAKGSTRRLLCWYADLFTSFFLNPDRVGYHISAKKIQCRNGKDGSNQDNPMRSDPLSDYDDPVDYKPDCGEDQQSDRPVEKASEKSAVNVAAGIQVADDPVRSEKGYKANYSENRPLIQGIDGQRKWAGRLVKNEAKQFSRW